MTTLSDLKLGEGIYTVSEVAKLLNLPHQKVHRWISKYWDSDLAQQRLKPYSWRIDRTRAVNFHTLVEMYIFMLLTDAGVAPKRILEAHRWLSKQFNTSYPFASHEILANMQTDGKRVFFEYAAGTVSLDAQKQFQIEFVKEFFRKLAFDEGLLATRLFPLGRSNSVVIDPSRQFGHPVVGNTNIYPEALYGMYKAGESIEFIAHIYQLKEKAVMDAIDYCSSAA